MIHKKRVTFLPNISLKKFENLYHLETNAKSKIRLQCAILRKEGKTLEDISDVTKKPIDNGFPFVVWTTKLVGYVIKKIFGVIYSLRQIRNLLKRLMFSLQKQRPEHIKANKELQRQFKKKFGEELKNLIQMDMRSSFWTKAHSNLSRIS